MTHTNIDAVSWLPCTIIGNLRFSGILTDCWGLLRSTSGPAIRYRQRKFAIQFSMIVETTSCTPLVALSSAAGRPHAAPASMQKAMTTMNPTAEGMAIWLTAMAATAPM